MFREDEPRPILGATIALGSPFVITALNRYFNPELRTDKLFEGQS